MTIVYEKEYDLELGIDYEKTAEKVINAALDHEKCPYEIEVGLTLTDNEGIHEINKEQRDIDLPTDVLSFPLVDYESPADFEKAEEFDDYWNPDSGELMLGDIVINLDRVRSQAEEYGHSYLREYSFLIAHSMLHLMGYDHINENEAAEMEKRQEEILVSIGITRD